MEQLEEPRTTQTSDQRVDTIAVLVVLAAAVAAVVHFLTGA